MPELEKIRLVFESDDDPAEFKIESVWARRSGDEYIIDNIPFFAKNLALGDVISVEWDEDDEAYYFDKLIRPSGNSVVRISPKDRSLTEKIGQEIVQLACEWESIENGNLIAINIPAVVDYDNIKRYITDSNDIVDYQEACLGFR